VYGIHRFNGPQKNAIISSMAEMGRQVAVVLYVVAMAAIIVGVDFMFFRNRFWERLTVNIGIVLVFAAFYLIFLRRP
jgi:3-deoxy-D-manno-octulosonic-acid transferase